MRWDYNENAGKARGKKEEKVEVIERWQEAEIEND